MKIAFDVNRAIVYAWDTLWKGNLARRAKETNPRWTAPTYYLTSNDIERMVRVCAEATQAGKPWPTNPGASYIGGFRIKFRGNLQSTVRDWLFSEVSAGRLTYHNFGRGHISGARFRPAGEPMSPSEETTMAEHEKERARTKPKPVHFGWRGGGYPLCTSGRSTMHLRPSRKVRITKKTEEVTCKQCLNKLKQIPAEAKADATSDVAKAM